jgi:hypothetical protein
VRQGSSRDKIRKEVKFDGGENSLTLPIPTSPTNYSFLYRLLETVEGREQEVLTGRATFRFFDDFSHYAGGDLNKSWRLVADGDVEIGAKLHLSAGAPPGGPPAPGIGVLELQYHFEPGWKFMQLVPQSLPLKKIEGRPKELGLWVYGDSQGNVVRLRFTDSTGQTFQPAIQSMDAGSSSGKIDWTGWRYVTFPLDGANAYHWGGAEDGAVHYPIHFDSLFLLDSANRHETEGTVYLAAPTLIER